MFFDYGATTRNGKGTLNESILRVMGDYGCTSRPEMLSMKTSVNSGAPTEDVARLNGIHFNNISEPGKGLVLNAALVKTLTGNDTLNARFLHENSFDFRPQFKIYINTNYLPAINDMTLFSSGRVYIIPFERHFGEDEQDKTLKQEFAKFETQSAVLNWLIDGWMLLKSEGLEPPESVRAATESYRRESDKIGLFIEECLEPKQDAEERTSAIYSRYRGWCVENGYFTENTRNFRQALQSELRIERRRPRSGGGMTTLVVGHRLISEFLNE
jgi:putative DNA primase/helicase